MSRPTDLLGRIARARAALMVRGVDRLCLRMGLATAREFAEESQIADIEDWMQAVMNMQIIVSSSVEGFLVAPRQD